MNIFKKKKEKKQKIQKKERIQEGFDQEWTNSLPGEDFKEQDPKIQIGAAMLLGTREVQQDAFAARWIDDSTIVAMVCDGMGGLEGGEAASKTAIASVLKGIDKLDKSQWSLNELFEILREANDEVRELKNAQGEPMGCGTTLTLATVRDGNLEWMSVGDSRIFSIYDGKFRTVSKEHNYAFMKELMKDDVNYVINPEIRPDALVSYLGAPAIKYVDYNTVPWPLHDGDMLLLCSDGLTKLVPIEEIEKALRTSEEDLDGLAATLVEKAKANATERQDNTTVVLLRYKE